MPERDKILEAEESIQRIAAELKKMRDAAQLLQDSQQKTDAVMRAADSVITVSKEFANASSEIISRLSATDLASRFDAVHAGIEQIAGLMDTQAKKSISATINVEARIGELESALLGRMDQVSGLVDEQAKKTRVAITNTATRVAALEHSLQQIAKHARKQRMISIVLISITLVTSLSVLAVAFLQGSIG